ncbi:hypothetical protein [Streptomyces mesophilus]|uniref:hypothetical protein n=1 Tax=Streptomyces mesophilus TaxID=1775132 RepID=UPI003329746A
MSAGGRLSTLTRTRVTYTGEPFQFAKDSLKQQDNQTPLPVATGAQAQLESQIMALLGNGGRLWAHPTGISAVLMRPGHPPVIKLDGQSAGAPTSMNELALRNLLPCAEVGVQIRGAIGLRVEKVNRSDLHVKLVGTDSRAILRGIPQTNWHRELDGEWERLHTMGFPPLWEEDSLTEHEQQDTQEFPALAKTDRDISWLGSAMLRRISALCSASSAYFVNSWITGAEWITEISTATGADFNHHHLLAALTDPVWGAALRVRRSFCACDPLGKPKGQCLFYLGHKDGRTGTLQLRFLPDPVNDRATKRAALRSVGADAAWIDRVLPITGNEHGPGVAR